MSRRVTCRPNTSRHRQTIVSGERRGVKMKAARRAGEIGGIGSRAIIFRRSFMYLTQIAPLVATPLIARARRFWRCSNAGHSLN
jgi:hypothetical protein